MKDILRRLRAGQGYNSGYAEYAIVP